jgi:hypothetical protein
VKRRIAALAPLLAAIAVVLVHLRAFLPPFTLPARGDPSLPFQGSDLTPQWAPWLRVAIDALWRQGTIVFWDPFTNAGAPEFEVPQAGVVSLTTMLGGIVPVEAAIKWGMLAHVVCGMLGVYALSRRLRVRAPFGAFAALSFGLGTSLLDHFRAGHVDHVNSMSLAPWVIFFVWSALEAPAGWWRHACAAGVVLGVTALEGGTTVLVYTLLACCLAVVTCTGPEGLRRTRRLASVGVLTATCFFATAAPQMLPMLSYVALTGRSQGLSLPLSMAVVNEVAHPLPTISAAILMIAGVAALWINGQRRAAMWLAAIVAAGVMAATVAPVYAFLWRFFPGIRYQRIPQRALALVGIAGPILIAAGAEGVWTALARWRTPGLVLGSVGLVFFACESWMIAPLTPPMLDPRIERQHNHAMRWLADHAAGSRMHIWESGDRQWGTGNVTVPLGLEAITSYTPSEHRDYLPWDFDRPDDPTFVGESYRHPAKFWGLLNVRYVLSTVPVDDPGFKLAAQVQRCPIQVCQPAKSAGPYIYENQQWLPRAWVVPHAIALVGPERLVFAAALEMLAMEEFDPRQVVVLQLRSGATIPPVDRLFALEVGVRGATPWNRDRSRQALSDAGATHGTVQAATFSRRNNNRLEFQAPADGWLVMSEKLALYRGWTASIDDANVDLFRADGVLAAVKVRDGNIVRASYEPPGFRLGVSVFALMIGALVVAGRSFRVVSAAPSPSATHEYRAR